MSEPTNNSEETGAELLDPGWLELCLKVKNLKKSVEFYEKIGFTQAVGDMDQGVMIMECESAVISLYEGHIEQNLLNFRGGDVQKIADTLKANGLKLKSEVEMEEDGSLGCTVQDPDGNLIYFNTHPDELLGCDCEECDDETCDCGHEHGHHHHH